MDMDGGLGGGGTMNLGGGPRAPPHSLHSMMSSNIFHIC